MATHRLVVVGATLMCLGSFVLAQDEELPLSNWSAPPYWSPAVQTRSEAEPGGGMLAQAQGMQAHAQALPSSPLPFVAIAPCRIVDTREAISDGFHQPNFADDESRTFPFPASPDCTGLPATSGAWSLNIQFRPISQLAFLTAYPTGTTRPGVSTLTAGPAAWVQNAAVVPAGTGGAIDIYCQYAGRVVIDINGYYGPQSVVTSLNALSGTLALAEGSNVGIYPSGSTITISAQGGPGGDLPAGSESQTLRHNGKYWEASSALTNDGTDVGISGNLELPDSTASSGQIKLGVNRFLHNYAQPGTNGNNTFLGELAGNFTMGGVTASAGSYNAGLGFETLYSNTTGNSNTATGYVALHSNTEGYSNTANGAMSLFANTTGNSNTANGAHSLAANTTGYMNTANGDYSLPANTAGRANCAFGAETLRNNQTAGGNAAFGYQALYSQSYDNGDASWYSYNTAVGFKALYSNQPDSTLNGTYNSAVGFYALYANTTGHDNAAIGSQSLFSNQTGSFNTALGVSAGVGLTTGSNNTFVGYNVGYAVTDGSYNIIIGDSGAAADDHTIRIGHSQTRTFIDGIVGTDVGTNVPVVINGAGQLGTESSSIRFKQDVADMGDTSSRLMELRPVTFRYRAHPDGPLRYGLIAEEVERVMPELVVTSASGRPETVAYHELPAMLLNEVQKLRATVQAQQTEIQALKNHLAEISTLKAAVEELRRPGD